MKSDTKHPLIISRENLPFFAFFLVSFSAIFGLAWSSFFVSGDTLVLINSLKTISACLENRKFDYCEAVAHFPASQHLVGFILHAFGVGFENLLDYFKGLNLLAWFTGLFLPLVYWKYKKHLPHLLLYFLVYLSSPLWWYGNASFNEIFTATLISLFLLSLMYGVYLPILTSFLVVLTKEIAFVYVIAWTVAIAYLRLKENKPQVKTVVLSSIFGTILGLCIQILFNLWRFNSAINSELLLPIYRVQDFNIKLDFFFAQWLAPNTGVLLFWPGLTILIAMYFHLVKNLQWYFSRTTVIVFLLSLTVGFASWCAPFGWVAYGHRLIIPWLPGLTLFMLYSGTDAFIPTLKRVVSNTFLKYFIVVTILTLTVPNIAILFNIGSISNFFIPDSTCPTPAILQTDAKYYYDCIRHYAWNSRWIHSVTLSHTDWPKAMPAILLCLVSIVFLFRKISKAIREA